MTRMLRTIGRSSPPSPSTYSRVDDIKLHPQPPPPAKADSDHGIVLYPGSPHCALKQAANARQASEGRHSSTGSFVSCPRVCKQRVVARAVPTLTRAACKNEFRGAKQYERHPTYSSSSITASPPSAHTPKLARSASVR